MEWNVSLHGADQVRSLAGLKTQVSVNTTGRICGFLYVCRNPFSQWCCGVLVITILRHGGAAEVFPLRSFRCAVLQGVTILSHHGAI
jgi:hypothetical protein